MDMDDVKKERESPGIEGKDLRIHRRLSLLSIFVIMVLACNLPCLGTPVTTPTQPDEIHTAATLTLTAQLTQAAPTTQPPGETSLPSAQPLSETPLPTTQPLSETPLPTTQPPSETPLPPTQTLEPTDTAVPTAMPTRTAVPTAMPTHTTAPSLTPTLSPPPPFAVTGVTANVNPVAFTGPCPAVFTWSAAITVNGPGTVTYQWEVEGGGSDPVQSLEFSDAGSQTVTKQTSDTVSHPNITIWRRVHILTPNEMVSNQATKTLTCPPDIDVKPSTISFGEVACGRPGYYAVLIENLNYGMLDISSVKITSGGAFFSIADDSCTGSSLHKGEQCPMAIQFGPLGVCGPSGGNYVGNLRIRSNDLDEGTVNVDLRATQE